MQTPAQMTEKFIQLLKKNTVWRNTFLSTFLVGMLIHMPIFLNDFPNHDGLASMYFDQNMITSGRWFLQVACGFSSYFTLPWMIGLLSILFLAFAAVELVEFLEIKDSWLAVIFGGILVSFPALASTYAYIFTADGYMLGLALAIAAPLFTKKYRLGFLTGGICLAFSMGIYQSYLPFAILLSLYGAVRELLQDQERKQAIKKAFCYLWMGIIGVGLYYVLLQILLKLQGKVLDTYQGISGMAEAQNRNLVENLKYLFSDFLAFTGRGNVVYNNLLSLCGILLIVGSVIIALVLLLKERKLWKSPWFYIILLVITVIVPIGTNIILMISPEVNYHLLMRYQWCLFIILAAAFVYKVVQKSWIQWIVALALVVLVGNYAVTDNIAYSNLSKKYEKTYAYCLRLADRMEQFDGYYTGMPVAMIGLHSEENYPLTDLTGKVTDSMIGMSGDCLLYTRTNYQAFFKNYLGITMNLVTDEQMEKIYYSEEYQNLGSFPSSDCMKIVDGILYIKLE